MGCVAGRSNKDSGNEEAALTAPAQVEPGTSSNGVENHKQQQSQNKKPSYSSCCSSQRGGEKHVMKKSLGVSPTTEMGVSLPELDHIDVYMEEMTQPSPSSSHPRQGYSASDSPTSLAVEPETWKSKGTAKGTRDYEMKRGKMVVYEDEEEDDDEEEEEDQVDRKVNIAQIARVEDFASKVNEYGLSIDDEYLQKKTVKKKADDMFKRLHPMRTKDVLIENEDGQFVPKNYLALEPLNPSEGMFLFGKEAAVLRALGKDKNFPLPLPDDEIELIRHVKKVDDDDYKDRIIRIVTRTNHYTIKFKKSTVSEDDVVGWVGQIYRYK